MQRVSNMESAGTSSRGAPSVAFLGIAERYAHVTDPQTNLPKWNVLGLKSVVVSFVYPMMLHGYGLCLAFYQAVGSSKQTIVLKDQKGQRRGSVDVGWELRAKGSGPSIEDQAFRGQQWLLDAPWTFVAIPGEKIGLIA